MNRRRHAVIMARPAMCGSLPPRKLLCACLVALLGGFAGSVWSAEQPATVQCDSDIAHLAALVRNTYLQCCCSHGIPSKSPSMVTPGQFFR